jgi:hypothetical protein
MTTSKSPLGQVLKVKQNLDGMSRVQIDNGATSTINIICHTEGLESLLQEDLAAIREHLMTRKPGHFRRKS